MPKNGNSKTNVLSSNHTLFWRIFLPVFGTVILMGLMLAFWLTSEDNVYDPLIPLMWMRILLSLLFLAWLYLVYRTIWRLKRVDANDTHLFATDYWTTVRYPWGDVERIEEQKRAGRRIVSLWLRAPGRFGQKISFLPGTYYDEWMKKHGEKEDLIAN